MMMTMMTIMMMMMIKPRIATQLFVFFIPVAVVVVAGVVVAAGVVAAGVVAVLETTEDRDKKSKIQRNGRAIYSMRVYYVS